MNGLTCYPRNKRSAETRTAPNTPATGYHRTVPSRRSRSGSARPSTASVVQGPYSPRSQFVGKQILDACASIRLLLSAACGPKRIAEISCSILLETQRIGITPITYPNCITPEMAEQPLPPGVHPVIDLDAGARKASLHKDLQHPEGEHPAQYLSKPSTRTHAPVGGRLQPGSSGFDSHRRLGIGGSAPSMARLSRSAQTPLSAPPEQTPALLVCGGFLEMLAPCHLA